MTKGTILLAAGGTGGHVFPAEALAHELSARGWSVHLATDDRAGRYAGTFPAESHAPVTYPFALMRRAENNAQARAFLAFLAGPEARPTWERFGFRIAQ